MPKEVTDPEILKQLNAPEESQQQQAPQSEGFTRDAMRGYARGAASNVSDAISGLRGLRNIGMPGLGLTGRGVTTPDQSWMDSATVGELQKFADAESASKTEAVARFLGGVTTFPPLGLGGLAKSVAPKIVSGAIHGGAATLASAIPIAGTIAYGAVKDELGNLAKAATPYAEKVGGFLGSKLPRAGAGARSSTRGGDDQNDPARSP